MVYDRAAMKVLISSIAIALAVTPVICGQEESASPAAEKKSYPEVPKEYEVGEETVSPDGRFALLYPVRDEDSGKSSEMVNVLVRLKPYRVLVEMDDSAAKGMRGAPTAKWGGNQFVAIWREMKWGNEDLVVYQIANDQVKREEKIWPEVVKYFDRDWKDRFLKKYPKEANDRYFFSSDNSKFKNFEFKDDTLLLDIRAENKPNLAAGPIWSAELRAIWNLKTGKFDKVDFKPGEISIRKPEDI